MKNIQSKSLTQFYNEYLAWVIAGAPVNSKAFTRTYGLCGNLADWASANNVHGLAYLLDELIEQLEDSGLDHEFPFNANRVNYQISCKNGTHHMNLDRLAWVRAHSIEVS